MRKTVLIIGISSFVGSNLAEILKDDFRVVGTYFKTPVNIPGVTSYPCDVLKKDYVSKLIGLIKPDFTIYAVGMSSLTECKLKPKLSDALNSAGAVNCCTSSERIGSKFVFISSAFVLGGDNIMYKEGDTPFPNTQYGNSLSATEFYVQRSCLNYLILRCSVLYGWSYNPSHPNWFNVIQNAFAKNLPLEADDSVRTGFLDIFILGKIIKLAFEANITNRLIQISSYDFMTRYEFAQTYARVFKKDANIIHKFKATFPADSARKNQNADSNYAFKMDTVNASGILGTKLPKIEESLQFTLRRLSGKST